MEGEDKVDTIPGTCADTPVEVAVEHNSEIQEERPLSIMEGEGKVDTIPGTCADTPLEVAVEHNSEIQEERPLSIMEGEDKVDSTPGTCADTPVTPVEVVEEHNFEVQEERPLTIMEDKLDTIPETLTISDLKESPMQLEIIKVTGSGTNIEDSENIQKTPNLSEVTNASIASVEVVTKRKLTSDDDKEVSEVYEQHEDNPKGTKRFRQDDNNHETIPETDPEIIDLEDFQANYKNIVEVDEGGTDEEDNIHSACKEQQGVLFKEIDYLRGKLDRLIERQMLMEDFSLVEFGSKFRTFFHARDRLLDLGKQRAVPDPAHVLAPGSSYLISILKFINDKSADVDADGEELNLNDADIKKIEMSFRTSKTWNDKSKQTVKKTVPSATATITSVPSGDNMKTTDTANSSTSTSVNVTTPVVDLTQSDELTFSDGSPDQFLLVNPLYARPNYSSVPILKNEPAEPTLRTGVTKGLQNVSKSNAVSTPITNQHWPSSALQFVCPNQVARSITQEQDNIRRQKNPKREKCGICGSQYNANELKDHANFHARIFFQCPVPGCSSLLRYKASAEECLKRHGLDQYQRFKIPAFIKAKNGRLTAIDQEDIDRLQETTANKITTTANVQQTVRKTPASSNYHPNVTHQIIQQRSVQMQQCMTMDQESEQQHHVVHQQSFEIRQQNIGNQNQSSSHPQSISNNGSLINQQRIQQQQILKRQQMLQNDLLRQQMLKQPNQQVQQTQSTIRTSFGVGASLPQLPSPVTTTFKKSNLESAGNSNSTTERPGYFTTTYVNSTLSAAPWSIRDPTEHNFQSGQGQDPPLTVKQLKRIKRRQRERAKALLRPLGEQQRSDTRQTVAEGNVFRQQQLHHGQQRSDIRHPEYPDKQEGGSSYGPYKSYAQHHNIQNSYKP